MVAVVGAVLLATGVVLAVLEPIFAGRSAPLYDEDSGAAEAKARRRVALVALRELEYDRATGKLDSADYEVLRAELAHNALAHLALAGGEEEANEDAELEAEIAEMRRALEAGLQCGACEHVNRFGARYCGECGVALADL